MRGPRGSTLALLALGGVVLATFADALLTPRVFFQRDILSYWYPGMAAFRRAVAEGSWPLWNPHVGFGAPLLADASYALAYPPTWLALVLPLASYYKLFAVGHCLWAAAGTWRLGRVLGLSALGAGVAGGAFALSGPFLSAVSLFHHYAGAAWMPWVLAAAETLVRRPGLGSAVGLGVAAGGQLLAGSGDLALVTGVLVGARLAWHLAPSRPLASRARGLAGPLLLAAALAVALGAAQWLPTLELAGRGGRPVQGAVAAYWSLHPVSLVDLGVPRLVAGAPLSPAARDALFEGRAPLLDCLYLGVGVLGVGGLALASGAPGARLALGGASFFLLAALGRHTAFYGALSLLPGFALMRYPQKHLLPFALCVALAAGFGADAWARGWPEGERRRARWASWALLAGGLGLVAGAAWLATRPAGLVPLLEDAGLLAPAAAAAALRTFRTAALLGAFGVLLRLRSRREAAPAVTTVLLLVLGGLDLVGVGRAVNSLAPPELVSHRPALADRLLSLADESRLHFVARPGCGRATGGPPGWEPSWRAALAPTEALKPPAGVRWGLDGSYDGQFTALEPRGLLPFLVAAAGLTGQPAGTRLLQVGNVGHVLLLAPRARGVLEVVETRETPYECPLYVLRVPEPLPRAYVVTGERRLPAGADELGAVLDPTFDPRREVLVAEPRPGPSGPGGRARVVSRAADRVEVEAELAGPGVLVLVEAFDPDWRVAVDGRPAPLLRANALFRGVRLEAGRHRVLFTYRPPAAAAGLALAVGGALAAAGAWGRGRRRSLKSRVAASSITPREEGAP